MAGSRLHGTSVRSYALAAAPAASTQSGAGLRVRIRRVCASVTPPSTFYPIGRSGAVRAAGETRGISQNSAPSSLRNSYMNMSHVRNGYDPVPVAQKTPRAPARLMGHRKKILAIGFKPRARSLAGNASMLPSSRKANAFSKSFGEA